MRGQRHASGQQGRHYCKNRIRVPERRHRQRGRPHRTDECVNRIPRRVDPRNLVRKKLDEIKKPGHPDDERIRKNREPVERWRQRHPIHPDRQTGHKYREVKVYSRQARQSERHPQQTQFLHAGSIGGGGKLSRRDVWV